VARQDVAIQETDKAIEKITRDTDVGREQSETAKRDVQLAKTEIERLNAEGAKLTAALERLETEKTAAEAKAHTMESVAYGGIAISVALLAIVSSVLFVNWRKATAAKRQGVESETKPPEVIGDSAVVKTRRTPEGGDSQPSKASDTASSAPELAHANIARSRDESGVSKSKAGSDTAEEYVTLPI
jgi:hypothetical protein